MEKKMCILYDNRICDNCGECNMCDLDPKKVCDSCGACLETDEDYNTLDVDLVYENADDPEMLSFEELFPDEAFGGDRNWDDEEDEDENVIEDYDDYDGDFDNNDGFYDENEFYSEDDEDDLRRDFGDFFGRG
ncbi:MAG: hypothetical protein E7412_00145 [Ruminococcaceae bacterium]|nr:hypothetical protein [Oscillospiraceae bacterium]